MAESYGDSDGMRRFLPARLRPLFAENRHVTPRRFFNYLLLHLEMRLGRSRLLSRPYELCIDVSNKCNLACPFCPTGRRESGRGKGSISFDNFASIVDELAPYAFSLELFNWGEAFFNRELPRLIAHARRRRLVTVVSSNLSFKLSEQTVREIVASGLTHLTASVDGADQGSYEVYRRGGRFDLVMDNLRAFVRLKRETNSPFPILNWVYLIFAHNEDRVEDARRLAQEIGVDRFAARGGLYDDPSWAPRQAQPVPYLAQEPDRCVHLWKKAVFHWDGGVASCCNGFHEKDDFGAWRPGAFGRIWNNEKFVAARRIWTQPESPLPEGHFCVDCEWVRMYRRLPPRGDRLAGAPRSSGGGEAIGE